MLEGREVTGEDGVAGEAVAGEQGERAQDRGQTGREVLGVGAEMGRREGLDHVAICDVSS